MKRSTIKIGFEKPVFDHRLLLFDDLVKTQMEKMKIEPAVIEMAVNVLPELKRWRQEIPV